MKREIIKLILWIIITACIVVWTAHHVWPEKVWRLDLAPEDYLIK